MIFARRAHVAIFHVIACFYHPDIYNIIYGIQLSFEKPASSFGLVKAFFISWCMGYLAAESMHGMQVVVHLQ